MHKVKIGENDHAEYYKYKDDTGSTIIEMVPKLIFIKSIDSRSFQDICSYVQSEPYGENLVG